MWRLTTIERAEPLDETFVLAAPVASAGALDVMTAKSGRFPE